MLIEKVLRGDNFSTLDLASPKEVVLTLEAQCNLACLHCCWSHEIDEAPSYDSEHVIEQLASWNAHVSYAGRILTPRAARVIEAYCTRYERKVEVTDHGLTILRHPQLFDFYDHVNISIDGIDEDHDVQRGRRGSAEAAWNALLRLRKHGCDPAVAACITPLNIERWDLFEEKLVQHDMPLSCTFIYRFAPTMARNTISFFEGNELRAAFAKVANGVPKHIKLYDSRDVRDLLPQLCEYEWKCFGDYALRADLPNGSSVFWMPLSLQRMHVREILWDGRVMILDPKLSEHEATSEVLLDDTIVSHANKALHEERELMRTLLMERR